MSYKHIKSFWCGQNVLENDHAWKTEVFPIRKRSIIKLFFYVKCCCDSDIVKRQHFNDKDSKENQVDG